jgi:hypothetical protein
MNRMRTAEALAAGVLNRPAPATNIPGDREVFDAVGDGWTYAGADTVKRELLAGMLVAAYNYHGIPYAWKDGDWFRCVLLQYLAVTDSQTFATVNEAEDWFRAAFDSMYG